MSNKLQLDVKLKKADTGKTTYTHPVRIISGIMNRNGLSRHKVQAAQTLITAGAKVLRF